MKTSLLISILIISLIIFNSCTTSEANPVASGNQQISYMVCDGGQCILYLPDGTTTQMEGGMQAILSLNKVTGDGWKFQSVVANQRPNVGSYTFYYYFTK